MFCKIRYTRFSIIIILTISIFSLAKAQPQLPSAKVSPEKQRKAEQVVIRALNRYGQTLNFADVYRELYIKDRTARLGEKSFLLSIFIDEKLQKNIDKSILDKGFAKGNNVLWLWMICIAEENKYIDNFENELDKVSSKQQQTFYKNLANNEDGHFLKSKSDVINMFSIGSIAENLLRKRITQKIRRDLRNKVTIDSFKEIPLPDGKTFLAEYKHLYEIEAKLNDKWLPLTFTVVEENGVMRISSAILILDD